MIILISVGAILSHLGIVIAYAAYSQPELVELQLIDCLQYVQLSAIEQEAITLLLQIDNR